MKLTRNRIIAGAIGLAALAFGVVAVQAATSPSTSNKNYAQVFVDKLAGILHLSSSQTQDDLKQAELQTIDQMVKDGVITQAQADAMKQRINSGQNFAFPRFGGFDRHGSRALLGQVRRAELDAVAKSLSMSATDLMSHLRAGKSLGDLETAKGVTDAAVRAAAREAAKGVLDPAVKAGTITQAQEDKLLQRIDSGHLFRAPFTHEG
jgi:polyhydroxyalkanoate synthesis regulator phasin